MAAPAHGFTIAWPAPWPATTSTKRCQRLAPRCLPEGYGEAKKVREKALDNTYDSGDWELLYEDKLGVEAEDKAMEVSFDKHLGDPDPIPKLMNGGKIPPLGHIAMSYVSLGKLEKAKACCEKGYALARQN